MWIIVSELIIFGIILSLILGYFGGMGLGVNKEVQFKEIVNERVIHTKSAIEHLKKSNVISGDINYKIEKVLSQTKNSSYISYKIILTDSKGNSLSKSELVKIANAIMNNTPNTNTSKDNNTDTDNTNRYIIVNNTGIEVTPKITDKWNDGLCYRVKVTNNSNSVFYNWRIRLDLDSNANMYDYRNWTGDCINGECILNPESRANPLKKGEKISMGFCVKNTNKIPKSVKLEQKYIEKKSEILQSFPSTCQEVLSFNGSNQFGEVKLKDKVAGLDLWNLSSAKGYAKYCYDNNSSTIYYNQDLYKIKREGKDFVIGYPELYIGSKPWNDTSRTDNGDLPVKLGEVNSLVNSLNYEIKSPSNLSMNIATEGWFTKNKYDNEKNSDPNSWIEFMIMWYRNLHDIDGKYIGSINANIKLNDEFKVIPFKIYVSDRGWKFIKLVPVFDNSKFKEAKIKFDIKEIVEKTNNKLSGIDLLNDYYLSSWHFGTEWGDPYTKSAYLSRKVNEFNVKKDTNNTNMTSNNGILFYYGYPSLINGSSNIEQAESILGKYKKVILGWGLQNYTHPEFKNTYKIIHDLNNTEFYGYIPLYNGGNINYTLIFENILKWKALGVRGIFFDEAGYDYFKQITDYNTYKNYINLVYEFAKKLGLDIIINGYTTEYLDFLNLSSDDIVAIEDCLYYNGNYKDEYKEHTQTIINKVNNLSNKPNILCLATGKSNNKSSVEQIFANILNENLSVDYISVQDDYGPDSQVYWMGK